MGGRIKYSKILTKDFLNQEYIEKGRSVFAIARDIGCRHPTVTAYLRDAGISIRPKNKKRYDDMLTKDFLQREYSCERKSALHIAKKIGCDRQTVLVYLHFYEIPLLETVYPERKMTAHPGWQGYGDLSLTQFKNIAHNAKIRNIDFRLTIEELWELYLCQSGKCALSGMQIGFVHSKKGNASLDRIDSTKPYEKGNVWWVHKDVNLAKQSLSVDQFLTLCRNVSEHNS